MHHAIREFIFARDHYTCQGCGLVDERGLTLEVDHRWPRSKGGRTIARNLQTLCRACNLAKGDDPWWVSPLVKARIRARMEALRG